jgi:hypothetical protein
MATMDVEVMARRRSLTSQLYRAARVSNNVRAIASGNPFLRFAQIAQFGQRTLG